MTWDVKREYFFRQFTQQKLSCHHAASPKSKKNEPIVSEIGQSFGLSSIKRKNLKLGPLCPMTENGLSKRDVHDDTTDSPTSACAGEVLPRNRSRADRSGQH